MREKKLLLSIDTSTCLHGRKTERSTHHKIKYIDRCHYISGHRRSMSFMFKTILFIWTLSNSLFSLADISIDSSICFVSYWFFPLSFLRKGNKEGANGKNVRFIKPSYNVIVGIGYKEYLASSKLQREQWVVPALMSSTSSQGWGRNKNKSIQRNKNGYTIPMSTHLLNYLHSIMKSNA